MIRYFFFAFILTRISNQIIFASLLLALDTAAKKKLKPNTFNFGFKMFLQAKTRGFILFESKNFFFLI
jgi:hypothetical protein